jgi:hypothetical protein
MRGTNRISVEQYAFLRDVRDGTVLLGDLKVKHKLAEKRFSRWMRGEGFQRGLSRSLRESMKRRHLELQLAANVAAEIFGEAVRARTPIEWAWLITLEKVHEQALKESQARRSGGRARGRRKTKRVDRDADLCHPNAKAREEKLLAGLEGRGSEVQEG